MKNILKITGLLFVLLAYWSCTNDKDPVVVTGGFELRDDASITPPTIFSEANKTEVFSKLNWDRSNYGPATVPSYTVVISDQAIPASADNEVELPTTVLNTEGDARRATLTVDELNTAINQLPSFNCAAMTIDIRVKSKLGTSSNAVYQYSNPISMNVTAYPKNPLIAALVKEGANPADASKIQTSSFLKNSDYEGYVYLEAGNYKLYKPNACGDFSSPVIYGLTGGNLIEGGSDSFNVPTTGHYLVKVNLSAAADSDTGIAAMSYVISPFVSFGIYGTARVAPTGVNVPMTYDPSTKKWQLTYSLFKGKKFRFRSENGPTKVSVLGVLSGTTLTEYPVSSTTGGDIRVPGTDDNTRQSFIITLDTSNPRNYTFELTPN